MIKKLIIFFSIALFTNQFICSATDQQIKSTQPNKLTINKDKIYSYGKELAKIGLGIFLCNHTFRSLTLAHSLKLIGIKVKTGNMAILQNYTSFIYLRAVIPTNMQISALCAAGLGIGFLISGYKGIRAEWAKK